MGTLFEEGTGDGEGGAFARVGGVGFEGGAEEGDALAGEGVEHCGDHLGGEARLLVFIHFDDLLPVGGDFGQALLVTDVDEVEDVFFEAGAAKADGGFEEFGADAGVGADGVGDLLDIGFGALTEGGDGIDGGDALGKEGVGDELGEL